MSASMNEPIDLILAKYDIRVNGIRNESYKGKKGVWWIQTPNGNLILKKMSNSPETVAYLLSAVRHLMRNGVNMPAFHQTKDGSDFAVENGSCFVLWNAIDGKTPSYAAKNELEMIVRGLGGLHKASRGFTPPAGSKPKVHLNTWITEYSAQVDDLAAFFAKESNGSSGSPQNIRALMLSEFPAFKERAAQCIKGLQGSEYAAWCQKISQTGCLCHQDFAAGNLILSSGKLFILDIDSLTLDLPARDIRKLLNKIMKKEGKWNTRLAADILRYYQMENPLSRDEWKVVGLDLLFPHLFVGAANKFYYLRDEEWGNDKYFARMKEMAAFEKETERFCSTFSSIIPV